MSIYQSIKDFSKKALVVGGLVAVLSGCEKPPIKTVNFNIDLNEDNVKESIYVAPIKGTFNDYELLVAIGNKSGSYLEPKRVLRIDDLNPRRDPYSVNVEDMNGDEILDLVVTKPVPKTFDDFEKVLLLGNGDGTFQDPKRMAYLEDYGTQ